MNDTDTAASDNRTVRRWKLFRRLLIGAVGLATLIAIFYTEENWRGKRAWEECKRELSAKGVEWDWSTYIPPKVQDEQNFFAAPNMQAWFVGRGTTNELFKGLTNQPQANQLPDIVVADLHIAAAKVSDDSTDIDSATGVEKLHQLVEAAAGPSVSGPALQTFLAGPTSQVKPVMLTVFSTNSIDQARLSRMFPTPASAGSDRLLLAPAGSNQFQLKLRSACSASDYLTATDHFDSDWECIRKALERPYARMEGNYDDPMSVPIPNFVTLRSAVQTLSARAQCHLLRGESEQALKELTLVHDLCRILEGRPTGKPMTLVSAMINVAVHGLYVGVVADGIRLKAWRAQDLAVIQEQLAGIDLPKWVFSSLAQEPVAICHTFDVLTRKQLAKAMGCDYASSPQDLGQHLGRAIWEIVPGGWIDFNRVTYAKQEIQILKAYNPGAGLIDPAVVKTVFTDNLANIDGWSVKTFLLKIALPNFSKAVTTCANNQTRVNEAYLVCALERCRLETGSYPEKLDELVPRFATKVPCDIIGGKPLHYSRHGDEFILYSVGWNETDDAGTVAAEKEQGDWVWGK